MERLRRLNLAQKIVVTVALAAQLRLVANYIVTEWVAADSGWFGYVPLGAVEPSPGARPFVATLVWLVGTGVWGAVSVWLLGLPADDGRHDSNP